MSWHVKKKKTYEPIHQPNVLKSSPLFLCMISSTWNVILSRQKQKKDDKDKEMLLLVI